MAIEYVSYAGALPYKSGTSALEHSGSYQTGLISGSSSEVGGTTWNGSGGLSSSYSSTTTGFTQYTEEQCEPVFSFDEALGYPVQIGQNCSTVTFSDTYGESNSFSTEESRSAGTYEQEMQTSTTVEITDTRGTVMGTSGTTFPTVTTGSVGSETFHTTTLTFSTWPMTTVGTESATYGQLALTSAGVTTITGAALWNTIVIADTALGEILIIPTSEGTGMLSDLCTTATATTFFGSVEAGTGGVGANDYQFTSYSGLKESTVTVTTTTGTTSYPFVISAFPVLTGSSSEDLTTTTTTVEEYGLNGYWQTYLTDLSQVTQGTMVGTDFTTQNYNGPGAIAYFGNAGTTGLIGVDVGVGAAFNAIPPLGVAVQGVDTRFTESRFAHGMAVPPQTTSFTSSGGFADAIDAGVMTGSYPAEQWVSVFPGVAMPMPVSTYLELNYTRDSSSMGPGSMTTTALVSYGSSGYSVTTATSSGSGSNTTRGTGSTFYSFVRQGTTEASSFIDGIAGGNPYFPNATYPAAGTIELQTWNASTSGIETTTFTGGDELEGDGGLTRIIPDASATAYHYASYFYGEPSFSPYIVTSFA
jgi:hypothetical protein